MINVIKLVLFSFLLAQSSQQFQLCSSLPNFGFLHFQILTKLRKNFVKNYPGQIKEINFAKQFRTFLSGTYVWYNLIISVCFVKDTNVPRHKCLCTQTSTSSFRWSPVIVISVSESFEVVRFSSHPVMTH